MVEQESGTVLDLIGDIKDTDLRYTLLKGIQNTDPTLKTGIVYSPDSIASLTQTAFDQFRIPRSTISRIIQRSDMPLPVGIEGVVHRGRKGPGGYEASGIMCLWAVLDTGQKVPSLIKPGFYVSTDSIGKTIERLRESKLSSLFLRNTEIDSRDKTLSNESSFEGVSWEELDIFRRQLKNLPPYEANEQASLKLFSKGITIQVVEAIRSYVQARLKIISLKDKEVLNNLLTPLAEDSWAELSLCLKVLLQDHEKYSTFSPQELFLKIVQIKNQSKVAIVSSTRK